MCSGEALDLQTAESGPRMRSSFLIGHRGELHEGPESEQHQGKLVRRRWRKSVLLLHETFGPRSSRAIAMTQGERWAGCWRTPSDHSILQIVKDHSESDSKERPKERDGHDDGPGLMCSAVCLGSRVSRCMIYLAAGSSHNETLGISHTER